MNYWLVRGNPSENGDFGFIKPGADQWRTKRPPRDWRLGDRLLFWASSPRLELIALGEFRGETKKRVSDGGVFYDVQYLTRVVDRPIRIAVLQADKVLEKAAFLKPGVTQSVVRLDSSQGEHMYRLLLSQNTSIAGTWKDLEGSTASLSDVDQSAIEGDRRLVTHFSLERSRSLAEAKKAAVISSKGGLSCEVCAFDFKLRYGDLGEGFCEIHHRQPLASLRAPTETRLSDLAVVCSNCHRILHRSGCALSVEELRRRLTALAKS